MLGFGSIFVASGMNQAVLPVSPRVLADVDDALVHVGPRRVQAQFSRGRVEFCGECSVNQNSFRRGAAAGFEERLVYLPIPLDVKLDSDVRTGAALKHFARDAEGAELTEMESAARNHSPAYHLIDGGIIQDHGTPRRNVVGACDVFVAQPSRLCFRFKITGGTPVLRKSNLSGQMP